MVLTTIQRHHSYYIQYIKDEEGTSMYVFFHKLLLITVNNLGSQIRGVQNIVYCFQFWPQS